MDMKALEYMGSRVDKAREIINNIKELQDFKQSCECMHSHEVLSIDACSSSRASSISEKSIGRESIKCVFDAIIIALEKEIERLNDELEEL